MFLATGPVSILGDQNFLKRVFFVAKMKKLSVTTSQNYYIGYAFVNRKNRKLTPNFLLAL